MKRTRLDLSLRYVTQLRLAFLGLAIPTVILAFAGWYVLNESQYRVERGRIAHDIYSALLSFDLEKAALRNWSFRRLLNEPGDPAQLDAIFERMDGLIARVAEKAGLARDMDRARHKNLVEHEERTKLLAFLKEVVASLEQETASLLSSPSPTVSRMAEVDTQFGQVQGVSPAEALKKALASEGVALEAERTRADAGLATARQLFLFAGGFGLFATFVLATFLVSRFRQPLEQLEQGLSAYQKGNFSYRFQRFRDLEFRHLGDQLNSMAGEVEQSRNRATEDRIELEQQVATRTAELSRTVDELAASEGARAQLLADIGHELRTPVTVIRGEAQVALRQKNPDSSAYRAALERVVTVSRQMGHLIEDLLVLVRDPKARPVIECSELVLGEVIHAALEAAGTIAAERAVQLKGPDPLPKDVVEADPNRLRQVLVCLIDNAIRYSHPGGEVQVSVAKAAAERIEIDIIDQGIGISAEDLPHVFDRGWRSSKARTHRPDGLGLGLAIAWQLTEAQGGSLMILESPQGTGTLARLSLPLSPPLTDEEPQ